LVVTESAIEVDFTTGFGLRSHRFGVVSGILKFSLPLWNPSRTIPRDERSHQLTLTCPSCGNSQNFLVKTLQMHVVHLEDSRVEVSEEMRPTVLEVLCDECEMALKFEEFEDALRKEVLLTLGAR
jgi:ribosomal protein S27E